MIAYNIKRLSTNGSVVSAAIILGAASLASRVVGLIRERVFTTTFGAGDTFDAFVAAFRVPDLIFNLIVIGALSAAFIPMFTGKLVKRQRDGDDAFTFAASILNIIVLVVALLSVVFALLAPIFVPLLAPGFSESQQATTVQLSRIMALQPILLAVSFVFSGVLNSYKRFVAYALAPIFYNIGIIFGVLVFVPRMGVAGLGWGVVLGAVLHVLVQVPSMMMVGFRWKPVLISSNNDILRVWRMMLPRVFGLAAQQVNLLVVTILGSGLVAGSIAAFHLANNIQHIPIGIFGIAFAQAAFPTLSEHVAREQKTAFRHTLTRTFRYILYFVVPVSAFFYLLRAQIVRVLFGDGAFDWEDTILTFETFGFLIISIFAQATIPLLTRAFYAQEDTKTPVIIATIGMVANVLLAVILSPIMGAQGLALAFSASAIIQLALLLGVLHFRLDGFDDEEVLRSMLKIVAATLVASAALQLLKEPIALMVDMQRFWGVFVQLAGTAAGGVLVYLLVTWKLGLEEIVSLRKYFPRSAKLEPGKETSRFSEISE